MTVEILHAKDTNKSSNCVCTDNTNILGAEDATSSNNSVG